MFNYPLESILAMIILSFIAGFMDAVVGGGGLISLPGLLVFFPHLALPFVLGTNKIAALAGTSIAAFQYSKKINFNFKLLTYLSITAFVFSFLGAKLVSYLDNQTLKPFLFLLLILIAIYTWFKKDFGSEQNSVNNISNQTLKACLLSAIVGLYDGFFGPGTGSFFVLGFVLLLGMDFLHSSAYAKIVNCVTNIAALTVFIYNGTFLLDLAILMAVSNMTGSFIGSKLALNKGNSFVRLTFISVVGLMIVRYGYDIFWK